MDETVAQAKKFRLAGQDGMNAEQAVKNVLVDGIYRAVKAFEARPIYLVRDGQGSLNDHIDGGGRKPSLWEVCAVAEFQDGDLDRVGVFYAAAKADG